MLGVWLLRHPAVNCHHSCPTVVSIGVACCKRLGRKYMMKTVLSDFKLVAEFSLSDLPQRVCTAILRFASDLQHNYLIRVWFFNRLLPIQDSKIPGHLYHDVRAKRLVLRVVRLQTLGMDTGSLHRPKYPIPMPRSILCTNWLNRH
jgi:hypothetical protein